MNAPAALFAAACALVLFACWWFGVRPALDPGGYPERAALFDRHWWLHVLGAALTVAVGVLVFRVPLARAVAVSLAAWVGVEAIQRWPRFPYPGGRPGRFSVGDCLADVVGVGLAWALGAWWW